MKALELHMTSLGGEMIRLQDKWKIKVILYCFSTPAYFCTGLWVKIQESAKSYRDS